MTAYRSHILCLKYFCKSWQFACLLLAQYTPRLAAIKMVPMWFTSLASRRKLSLGDCDCTAWLRSSYPFSCHTESPAGIETQRRSGAEKSLVEHGGPQRDPINHVSKQFSGEDWSFKCSIWRILDVIISYQNEVVASIRVHGQNRLKLLKCIFPGTGRVLADTRCA